MTIEITQKHYSDVIRYGHKTTQGMFNVGDPIVIQEKLDGANASFRRVGDKILAFSRKTQLNAENNLRGFYEWTQTLDAKSLIEDCPYFGEWSCRHKIDYGENLNKFYMYDIYSPEKQKYLDFDIVKSEAGRLGLNLIPVLYEGPFVSFEHLQSFVGKSEVAPEGVEGEGIVVKNHAYTNRYGDQLFVKLVTDSFREIQSQKAPKDPNFVSQEQAIVETVLTKARVEKLLHKLVDEGVLDEQFGIEDMGLILKHLGTRVYEDIVKEEYDTIKDFEEKDVRRFIGRITPKITKEIINAR